MTPASYVLTTPYGRKTGRATLRIEREALELARVHLQLGEAHVELVLSGENLDGLVARLELVKLDASAFELLDVDPENLEVAS